jgi:hypothetical protein
MEGKYEGWRRIVFILIFMTSKIGRSLGGVYGFRS